MLSIDGSYGEGGGQIIRTALTLSCITQTPIHLKNIRTGRSKAGLRAQHLTCVNAAAEICGASVEGDYIGSSELVFRPQHQAKAGQYHWVIKTAGATSLVAQTVMLPLVMASGSSEITIEGGTHVPWSPSGHYLRDVYAPMLVQSGADVLVNIPQFGWYPKGGGKLSVHIDGWSQLHGQDLSERGELERIFGAAIATNLPVHVPQRISQHVQKKLAFLDIPLDVRLKRESAKRGAGAAICLTAEYANGRAGFTALGEKGLPSEKLAEEVAYAFQVFDAGNATVDQYIADQLILVLALAPDESQFITPHVTEHLRTNAWVIQQFLSRSLTLDEHTGTVKIGAA